MATASTISRRRFLGGDFSPGDVPLRPPWAIPEARFVDLCTGCADCVRSCEPAILKADSRGFPEVDFSRGECTFCGACAASCRFGALTQPQAGTSPWAIRATIDAGCLAHRGVMCTVCREHCGANAITLRRCAGHVPLAYINPESCTGCGACLGPCPSGSIRMIAARTVAPRAEASCI